MSVAICMINVDKILCLKSGEKIILTEFRDCFQKIKNNMDICIMCCHIVRKFLEICETG